MQSPESQEKGPGGPELSFRFQGQDGRGLPLEHESKVAHFSLARGQVQAFRTIESLELKASGSLGES